MFDGFLPPTENWSKLPHQFIEALPQVETIGEMKVILYVLRHTWGYHDTEKRITLDEFQHGRKRRNGSRIDNGTGLSQNTIKDGIKRAVDHGFLRVEEDARDRARIKRYYSLAEHEFRYGDQSLPPRVSEVDPLPSEVDPRSEKETLETNLQKNAADGEQQQEIHEHRMVDETDKFLTCPTIGDRINVRLLDSTQALCPCGAGVRVYNEQGNLIRRPPQWLRRKEKSKGIADWIPAVRAFCDLAHIQYANLRSHVRREWAHKLQELADQHTLHDMLDAIPLLDVWNGDGKGLESPYQARFDSALTEHWLDRAAAQPEISAEDIELIKTLRAQ